MQTSTKNRCTKLPDVTQTYKKFAGGYGTASFSLKTLMDRANRGLCEFSQSTTDWTHMKWIKATAYLVPTKTISWLIHFENHFTNAEKDYKNKKKWMHPLHLLLMRRAKLVQALNRYPRGKWKKVVKRPSPELCYRWYDKETFYNFLLLSYTWSTIVLDNPFLAPGADIVTDYGDKMFWKNEWMKSKGLEFYDRNTWDKDFLNDNQEDWWKQWLTPFWPRQITKKGRGSPFCPTVINSDLEGFYFFYYFKFKLGGKPFDSAEPGDPAHEVKQLPGCFDPPDINGTCHTCLKPRDLDEWGFIKPRKFRAITSSDNEDGMGEPSAKKKKKQKKVHFKKKSKKRKHKHHGILSHGDFFFK